MRINVKSAYVADVDELLKDEARAAIEAEAIKEYGSFTALTLGKWIECTSGDYSCVLGDIHGTFLQVYWLKLFERETKVFVEALTKLSPKMDASEQRAASGLLKTTLAESLLVFVRNYFGLPSFKAAEDITLGEILIAKKASYNDTIFRKALSKIQTETAKKK